MKVIIAIVLLVFIIGGFIFLQIKNRNNKKEQPQVTASTRKSTKESRENSRSTYQVRQGDNLTKIAQNNGLTVAQLKKMNGLSSDNVEAGKVLRVK